MASAKWHKIPPTLHKVLVHGKEIIKATPVPVGWTSKEGSKSNTKFACRFHTSHTRKTSQEDTMSDLFNRLKDISDPVVVSYSKEKRNNKSIFQKTWQGYLKKCLNPKNLKMFFLKMTLSHRSIFL